MVTIIVPGRHLLMTRFQEEYFSEILSKSVGEMELLGKFTGDPTQRISTIIFAVTSANQENSRYNPISFHARAINIDRFIAAFRDVHGITCLIVPIPHRAPNLRFCELTLKEITEYVDTGVAIDPAHALILGSTPPVVGAYQALGYTILPAEYDFTRGEYRSVTPNDCIRSLAEGPKDWKKNTMLCDMLSRSTWDFWNDYVQIPEKVQWLWADPLLTDSGSLTEMRNYSTYAQGMGHTVLLEMKYADIRHAVVPGKIVDEGCADGALMTLLARDFPDSDIIGVELTSEFTARCMERLRAGEFGGTFVHFHQRNLLEPIFADNSVDTTICNSTTHEIWSYGERMESLRKYLRYKYAQLRKKGRLIIRDVVGPENKDAEVYLWVNDKDGSNVDPLAIIDDRDALRDHLEGLSTRARFLRFAEEFLSDMRRSGRRDDSSQIRYREESIDGISYVVLSLKDAVEFITKKDYTDNWQSELNEEFAFQSFSEWKKLLQEIGFSVLENPNDLTHSSRAYTIEWIVQHRYEGKVRLYEKRDGQLCELSYPVTNMVLIGEKGIEG